MSFCLGYLVKQNKDGTFIRAEVSWTFLASVVVYYPYDKARAKHVELARKLKGAFQNSKRPDKSETFRTLAELKRDDKKCDCMIFLPHGKNIMVKSGNFFKNRLTPIKGNRGQGSCPDIRR